MSTSCVFPPKENKHLVGCGRWLRCMRHPRLQVRPGHRRGDRVLGELLPDAAPQRGSLLGDHQRGHWQHQGWLPPRAAASVRLPRLAVRLLHAWHVHVHLLRACQGRQGGQPPSPACRLLQAYHLRGREGRLR
uniref:Cl1856_1 n=1 Tax=Arundo donax TaxID=35708 RepID=A0A0A9H4C3_ARUDO